MNVELAKVLGILSSSQKEAVAWAGGSALVLAGPGVGKTTVLTARIARLLDESRNRNFRILALTFTTKAGDEMRGRVEQLVPGLTERTMIGTFHSFAAQILRQHGSHLGIRPDFAVYDQDGDRIELLKDALREAAAKGDAVSTDDTKWLKAIDQFRGALVGPKSAAKRFSDAKTGEHVSRVYSLYQKTLLDRNIMDFNGLIFEACRLAHEMPAVCSRVQQSYPYWMIDEFQDTSPAQYRFIRTLAGETFNNVFAVADDDQIIYQWAGASYRQIVAFRDQFKPQLFQLVENRRCPPEVVDAANNLVSYNQERTPDKALLVATKPDIGRAIDLKVYATESDEASGVAKEIVAGGALLQRSVAVLGRTRAILVPILEALKANGVKASIATRRDRFISPQFVWLQACLDQSLRPNDRQMFVVMADAANRITGLELDPALLEGEAAGSGRSMLEEWAMAMSSTAGPLATELSKVGLELVRARDTWRATLPRMLSWLPSTALSGGVVGSDVDDDKAAWDAASRAIKSERGSSLDLAELLQGIALRPKEPPSDPGAVPLYTIHAAKGLEFDHVWVVGMAESVLPSWQSLKDDAKAVELEEERRNCFVAITRTRKTLTLTRAQSYRGWKKEPSRFLSEMGLS